MGWEAETAVETEKPQARRVQLLLVARPGVVVLQPQVLGGEEFGEEPDEQPWLCLPLSIL